MFMTQSNSRNAFQITIHTQHYSRWLPIVLRKVGEWANFYFLFLLSFIVYKRAAIVVSIMEFHSLVTYINMCNCEVPTAFL